MESIFIFLLFFILGPIIKGLIESDKTRKQWEQKQRNMRAPKSWPNMHDTRFPRERKRMYYDVNAERPQVETIIKEIKDKDYTAGEKTSFYVDKKGKDIKKAIKYKQKYISKSLVQEPSEKTQTLAECESLALEDIFAGNNLKYAIVLKEILDPPKAIRPIGKN